MNNARAPEMSVVLVTPDGYETIRKTLAHLRGQTARERLEIVIVAPSQSRLRLQAGDFRDFAGSRLVELEEIQSIGSANAAGVRHASAPVVALAEDHSFPDPRWAEVLIEAHRDKWAAVGPAVRNANPGSIVSWADFLIAYGPWMEGVSAGAVQHLPGHNSSYKRSVLLEYGTALDTMLEAESVLHWDLQSKGHRLYLEPRAKTSHLNFGVFSSWMAAQFYSARMFATIRSRQWATRKRLFYACAAPLIPAVRFRRILGQALQHSQRLPARVVALLMLGLIVSAAGEMSGYALGAGRSRKILTRLEFHRIRYIGPGRRHVAPGEASTDARLN
jgi:hypothetical protein